MSSDLWRKEVDKLFEKLKNESDQQIAWTANLAANISDQTDRLQTYLLIEILKELRK